MRKLLGVILIVALMILPVMGANDFANDPNLVGLWDFEDDLTDDTDNGNDLTAQTGVATYSTSHVYSGSKSYQGISGNDQMAREVSSLSAGFPLLTTSKKILTWVGWIRWDDYGAQNYIWTMGKDTGTDNSQVRIYCESSTLQIRMYYTDAGGNAETIVLISQPKDTDTHVGLRLNWAAKTWSIRTYRSSTVYTASGSMTYGIGYDFDANGAFGTGLQDPSGNPYTSLNWNGWLDEMGLFDRELTDDEIDAIRTGNYSPPGGSRNMLLLDVYVKNFFDKIFNPFAFAGEIDGWIQRSK